MMILYLVAQRWLMIESWVILVECDLIKVNMLLGRVMLTETHEMMQIYEMVVSQCD